MKNFCIMLCNRVLSRLSYDYPIHKNQEQKKNENVFLILKNYNEDEPVKMVK